MNCAECTELLVTYLEGLLDESQKQSVTDHLESCEACQAERKELQVLQQCLADRSKTLASSSVEDEVMNRIIREQNVRLKSAAQAGKGLRVRRLIMRSSIVKIAVAAAIVLVALGAWSLWSGTDSGVALADVLARVGQVRALTYRMDTHMKMTMPGSPSSEVDMKWVWLIADDYGLRLDARTTNPITGEVTEEQMYILPEQRIMTRVSPATKTYERMTFADAAFKQKKKETNDPRMIVEQFLGCQYEDLGKTMLDGIEVQEFHSNDPAFMQGTGESDVRMWVDVKTHLPVRTETKMRVSDQIEVQYVAYDFQWDVPVSAAEFTPVIPADYTTGPGDGGRAPTMTEEGAIEGLKFCAEFFGKYPPSLNPADMMQMTQSLMENPTPAAKKMMQEMGQAKSPEERIQGITQAMAPLQSLGMFYASVARSSKESAYYGHLVEPGDQALVLMRWKTGDNEYRVLFGDLHAETVSGETLATLEAALPK